MSTVSGKPSNLRDVLYELSLSKEVPDAETLDQFVRRYPEFADPLTAFAVEMVTDSLMPEDAAPVKNAKGVSPAVSRAMSKFLNAMHGNQLEHKSVAAPALSAVSIENPFAKLGRKEFRAAANKMHANVVFLCKLRDRQIDLATMTAGFLQFAAEALDLALNELTAYLGLEAQRPEPQFFKSDQKPVIQKKQSFEDAVRSSELSDEQQQFMLKL